MPDAPLARILILDDEAPQMKALCDTLRDHQYETFGFTSSADALGTITAGRYDLLITDLMMPEIDGISMLRIGLEKDPAMMGVLMTGQGTIDTAVEAMKTGAFDYVLKPFKLSRILPVISRALGVRQLRLENAALDRGLRERTAELEVANQELEAFGFSVSHDLRAPLRAIDGFAAMLSSQYGHDLPPDAQRMLANINTGAQLMGRLIEDLLRLSRLGRQTLTKRTMNVGALVESVVTELREQYSGRQIDFRLGNLPDCRGDDALLRQVFINLIGNACKFSRHKNPAIVEVDSQEQDGERIFFVRDNGAGFDMKYATRLFGVFQRFHTVEEFEGTGVGLSIVQRIIRRHGGRLWAEAKVNEGAAFYFTLPESP